MSVVKDVYDAVLMMFNLRHTEEEVLFGDIFEDGFESAERVAEAYLVAGEFRKAAAALEKLTGDRLTTLLTRDDGSSRSVRIGDMTVWRGEKTRERVVDEDTFWNWLSSQPFDMVRKLFNPNSARKGPLAPAERDTLFEKEKTGAVEIAVAPTQVLDDARIKKERE